MHGLWAQPARVLANRPLEAAGKCSTPVVLLGLPSSCLTASSSSGLSEGAGGGNRHEHVLLPFSGSLDPRAGPQAQGQEP